MGLNFAVRPHAWRSGLAAAWCALVLAGVPAAGMAQSVRELPDFTELAERMSPTVVNIRTTERVRSAPGGGGGEMDEQMREFFRRFGIPMPNAPRRNGPPGAEEEAMPQQRGVGSGFILSNDGFVMTNAHVVEGADEVIVTLTDQREFKAKIIGSDKRTDVAVVKIEGSGFPFVKTGDVNKLKVGEWVVAIGSPFGLENTVTAGIVSAKQRDTGDYLPLIQTDVAINPGNSGGPLLNLRGEVVGINSQIYSRSGMFAGLSFAIPIDEAIRVSDQLRATGRVVRGRIGVTIAPVTKDVAESIGLGKPAGAMVQGVEEGGPAQKAGIEAGDIITKVDGRAVDKSGDLPRIIGNTKPGAKTTLQVFRRGATRDLQVTVAELEPEQTRRVSKAESPASAPKTAIGLTVADLTDAQRKELKVRGGVRVELAEGAAARAGLREGDVILSVDNVEVTDAKQFNATVGKLDRGKPVSVLVRRGEWTNYAVIRPSR
ncbi:MAG: DegQ family serine endoprotease [Casimicrobiaceae bacterium]